MFDIEYNIFQGDDCMSYIDNRDRVIDSFLSPVGKDLSKAPRTTLNNTRIYRALNGELSREKFKCEKCDISEENVAGYKELREMDYGSAFSDKERGKVRKK